MIDTNNYYFERDGHIPELDSGETTTSEISRATCRDRGSSRHSMPSSWTILKRMDSRLDRRDVEVSLWLATILPTRRSSQGSMTSSASMQWMQAFLPRDGGSSAAGRFIVCRWLPIA